MHREIVAVDGVDGSGKSTLADRLLQAFGADGLGAVLLRVDDFRRPVDWSRADKSELDLYYDDYYDLERLGDCLRAFAGGAAAVEIPLYDAANQRPGAPRRLDLAGATIALVEGVFVQRVPVVSASATIIYVVTTLDEARRRLVSRDVARGRAPAEVERRMTMRYTPGQARYHAATDPVTRAAVVIDNQHPERPSPLRYHPLRLPPPLARALERIFTGG